MEALLNEEIVKRNYEALNFVYETCQVQGFFKGSGNLTRKYKLNARFPTIAKEKGLIRSEGSSSLMTWYWNTPVKPNYQMAAALVKEINKQGAACQKKAKERRKAKKVQSQDSGKLPQFVKPEPVPTNYVSPKKAKAKTQVKISLLWGLYSYTKTI